MPAVSEAQLRAMYAAKSGHSTLGIPQKVGADFVRPRPRSSGTSFSAGGGVVTLADPSGPHLTPTAAHAPPLQPDTWPARLCAGRATPQRPSPPDGPI